MCGVVRFEHCYHDVVDTTGDRSADAMCGVVRFEHCYHDAVDDVVIGLQMPCVDLRPMYILFWRRIGTVCASLKTVFDIPIDRGAKDAACTRSLCSL